MGGGQFQPGIAPMPKGCARPLHAFGTRRKAPVKPAVPHFYTGSSRPVSTGLALGVGWGGSKTRRPQPRIQKKRKPAMETGAKELQKRRQGLRCLVK